ERGEPGTSEQRPPHPARVRVARLRRLPVLGFLECRHDRWRRRCVPRLGRARDGPHSGPHDGRRDRDEDCPADGHGWPAAAGAGVTTRTVSPVDSESGGLLTMRSPPLSPERISTRSPKSRPLVTATSATRFRASTVATSWPSPL